MVFSSSHIQMWELVHKGDWAPQNWCLQTVVLERTLESPLHCKESKPVNPKGNQPWIVTGRTNADAETPILWLPVAKAWLSAIFPDAWKDWGQEKGVTKDEMVGWHHWLNGKEFEQTLGDNEGHGSLAQCSPLVTKSWTWVSNWTTETLAFYYCITPYLQILTQILL